MGKTLQDLLSQQYASDNHEKTASATAQMSYGDPEFDKLAQECGLFDEDFTVQPETNEKLASDLSDDLFNEMFPEEAEFFGDFSKEASAEEATNPEEILGSMTYDMFTSRFDSRIEKIAEELISEDSTHSQQVETNKPASTATVLNTTPAITNILPPQSGDHVIGDEREAVSPEVKQAAANDLILRHFGLR